MLPDVEPRLSERPLTLRRTLRDPQRRRNLAVFQAGEEPQPCHVRRSRVLTLQVRESAFQSDQILASRIQGNRDVVKFDATEGAASFDRKPWATAQRSLSDRPV